jgi:glycosyltransferase involved in cell wall biosynthesis
MAHRIAYLVSQYPAPSHTFIRREVIALRNIGFEIKTISIRLPGAEDKFSTEDSNEINNTEYILPTSLHKLFTAHTWSLFRHPIKYLSTFILSLRHRPPGLKSIAKSIFYFAESILVARSVSESNLEHIHNHFANPGAIVGLLASNLLGTTYSLTLHGISEFEYPAGLLISKKIAHANFAPCISYFTRAQACLHSAPEHWHKLKVIRSGIELNKINRFNDKQTNSHIQILSVGRLSREKGQLSLLKTIESLISDYPNISLHIIGEGPERERLEDYIAKNKLQKHCFLEGQQPEDVVLKSMADAQIFVMTSFMEGLPIVLLEAMATGIPVVAPCVAGIPELVHDGVNGLLYPPTDWAKLKDCIEKLVINDALRIKLAKEAINSFPEEFDVRNSVAILAENFRAV